MMSFVPFSRRHRHGTTAAAFHKKSISRLKTDLMLAVDSTCLGAGRKNPYSVLFHPRALNHPSVPVPCDHIADPA
jgi:hypothetical protein